MSPALRFQVGGALNRDSVYVKRPRDEEYLAQARERKAWINIHGCRTMGKSSLWVKHLPSLVKDGITVIAIDVAGQVGSRVETERDWMRALGEAIESELQLPRDLIGGKIKQLPNDVAAGVAFERTIEVLLEECQEPVLMILEEYDYIQRLDYCDEILFAFRHIQSLQARSTSLDRLSVCLVGLQPLMRYGTAASANTSPIASSVEMLDFDNSEETVNSLREGFGTDNGACESIISRVLTLSGGQPLVTMELLHRAVLLRCRTPAEIDQMTAELVGESGLGRDLQLFEAMERAFLAMGSRAVSALTTYMRLLEGNREADTGPGVELLLLYGLARRTNNRLEIKGELFRRRFNVGWAERMLSIVASRLKASRS